MKKYLSLFLIASISLLITDNLTAQYCTPSTSSTWGYINSVKTTGGTININKSGSAGAGYRNYTTTDSIVVQKGQTFAVEVKFTRSFLCWIDWNDDGDFGDAGEKVKAGPASTSNSIQTSTFNVTVPSNAKSGKLRMRVYSNYYYYATIGRDNSGCGYSNYQGEVEDYRLFVTPPKARDAEVTSLSPSAMCPGLNDIKVKVSNRGSQTISRITLKGTIGSTNFGPTAFTGLNIKSNKDTILKLGTFTFVKGTSYNMKFYSYSPNGSTDQKTSNDTLTKPGYKAAIGGTYTIGASSGADFSTFKAAEAAMAADGICAATVFNVEAGTYNEQVKFGTYVGIS
ncbi:MAG: GEVED domain-containing protein, partial [Flavobacteriales bacterium]